MRSTLSTPRALALLAALLLFGALACGGRRADVQVLDIGGLSREYVLHVPDGLDASTPRPLLLVLHGRGGKGPTTQRFTGFNAVADREGFLAVYPSGVDRSWADGSGASPADKQGVDDVGFLVALVEKIAAQRPVDRQRVYVAGISNGGFMTQRLILERPDVFRGAAVVIATMGEGLSKRVQPSAPVPFVVVNGTEDPLVPYNGGTVAKRPERCLSTDEVLAIWRKANGCPDAPDGSETIDRADDDTRVEIVSWTSSCTRAPVQLIRVVGGGHTWPGGTQYLPRATIGRVSREIDAQEHIWRFLSTPHTPRASQDGDKEQAHPQTLR